MNASRPARRLRPHARSFLDSLRTLLTPDIWKEAHQARQSRRKSPRWQTQPLVLTLLVMTWCCGDSQAERFETARAFTAVCLAKRRRPGRTVQGFEKALARLPRSVLRAVAAGVRRRLQALRDWTCDGWFVLGGDGSALECPRVAELERRLDPPAKTKGGPQVWVTALVHLQTGLLWDWRLGKGLNRERSHLRAMLPDLPAKALIVADAGYNGYELAHAIVAAGAAFLIRTSAKERLYTAAPVAVKNLREQEVFCWPQEFQRKERPPLPVRLIRIRSRKQQRDVWLVTNVLDPQRLTVAQAGQYYRWRWENEGLFRTYKRTLAKTKLQSRTVRLVHREAEGALLATQLLLAQGVLAQSGGTCRCSPRKVLMVIREVIVGRIGVRERARFYKRLTAAIREQRKRTTPKVKRVWPRRFEHRPPGPPKIRVLSEKSKALLDKLITLAA
jgi:Transposase DDE domain